MTAPQTGPQTTICLVGLGYIGLPTATVFALQAYPVIGLDVNEAHVAKINAGECPIVEPGLPEAMKGVVEAGHLRATTTAEPADAFLIAVPTPFVDDGQYTPDLRYIESAARKIAPVLKSGDLVVLESTSPVGATLKMAEWLKEERPDLTFPQDAGEASDIRIAHCPERILPGHALTELITNDRIIGGMTLACAERAAAVYRLVVQGSCMLTDCRTAEMAKLTENAFRDVNIAFANELSVICDRLDINVWELIRLANRHPRVNILQPGPGVGGHCIAVDPWFIVSTSPEQARVIRTAREVNDAKPGWVLNKIAEAAAAVEAEQGRPAVIGCCGLAFKANIDDLRESPSLHIVENLVARGDAKVIVAEPHISALPRSLAGKTELKPFAEVAEEADVLVLLVNHDAFLNHPLPQRPGLRLIDTRGIWPTAGEDGATRVSA